MFANYVCRRCNAATSNYLDHVRHKCKPSAPSLSPENERPVTQESVPGATDSEQSSSTQGWQPIETAPRHEDILGYGPCESSMDVIRWDGEYRRWFNSSGWAYVPTHWMPLPKVPIAATSGAEVVSTAFLSGEENAL